MVDIEVVGGELNEEEIRMYAEQVEAQFREKMPHHHIRGIRLTVDGDYVEPYVTYDAPDFERIRRITGYLVGTVDRFNNAKRAEEHDRVKHAVGCSCGH